MTTHSPLHRRRGLTLTEALVAMFVAAIGMICLMALFPLGALQMGQALKDARCTELATNAESLMRTHWRIEILEKGNDAAIRTGLNAGDPVFVDPVGRIGGGSANIGSIAGLPLRFSLGSISASFPRTQRFCSLLDDMTYNDAGAPVVTGPSVERAGRYNWTAVLQRAGNATADYQSKLTVLVFDGRAAGYVPPNSELVYGDPLVPTRTQSFIPGGSTLQLRFPIADVRPPIGKGRWIALYSPATGNKLLSFHRITSVGEENSTATTIQYDLQLQSPIPLGHAPADCRAIVFAGLAEVFERAPLSAH